jgi:hypothetical protein
MPVLAKLLPTILSYGFKFIKMRRTAATIEANPKATNGGIATIIVAVICLYAESIGMEVTPEVQEQLAAIVVGIGGVYTAWRASR